MKSTTKMPERPSFNDSVRKRLAHLVATDLETIIINKDIEEIEQDCYDIIDAGYVATENGYELAKRFEDDCRYRPDLELVETLDNVSGHYDDVLKQQYKEWVLAYAVQLEHPIGTKVIVDLYKKNNAEGEITKHYPETAQYGVWVSEMGEESKGKRHYIIHCEKIKQVL